jgi:hypothetical protein
MGLTVSEKLTTLIMPRAERTSDRLLIYGGRELSSNSNQDIELRLSRLLLYGAWESGRNLATHLELERHRLLLYGAPDLRPLPPLGPCAVLPLAGLRMRGAPSLLRFGVVTTVEAMLVCAPPKVARMLSDPGLDVRLLSKSLA